MNWNDVIVALVTTVGGDGVVLAAAAWLTREVISNRPANEATAVRINLEARANAEIERCKNELQMAAEDTA